MAGQVVLVGPFYGGAVMFNAAAGNQQVQVVGFFNGWMPDEGESIQPRHDRLRGQGPGVIPERRVDEGLASPT